MLAPSCTFFDENRVPIALNNLKVTLEQELLLTEVVAAIIPADEVYKGAADLKLQDFVWVMVDDTMKPEDQQRFLNGLNQFARYREKFLEKDWEDLPPAEQAGFLKLVMAKKAPKAPPQPVNSQQQKGEELPPEQFLADIQFFLNTARGRSIQGWLQSQYVMTEIYPYQLVPGGFSLCETIDPSKRINING